MSEQCASCLAVSKDKTVDSINVASMLKSAIARLEHKSEAIGREVGYEPTYWTRVLSNERGITLDRLGRLPVGVQCEVVLQWADALGLSVNGDPWPNLTELVAQRRVRITLEAVA